MFVLTYTAFQDISSLKDEFNSIFPFLKLEFIDDVNAKNSFKVESKLKSRILKRNFDTKKFTAGHIHIKDDMAVKTLEKLFEEQMGLRVRVFRKSGNSWIGTHLTNDWSLKRQNEEGNNLKLFVRDGSKLFKRLKE